MLKLPNKLRGRRRGFTLVELLVSLSLFIIVLTMGVGSLLVLINANAKAQNIQSAVSNVQFALDSMAREIRTGSAYFCSSNAGSSITGDYSQVADCNKGIYLSIIEGGTSLSQDFANRRLAYRYNATGKSIERRIGNGNWLRLTDPSVEINSMHFNVQSSAPGRTGAALGQPNVTIFISGSVAGVADTNASFNLQTTVTQRVIDL